MISNNFYHVFKIFVRKPPNINLPPKEPKCKLPQPRLGMIN